LWVVHPVAVRFEHLEQELDHAARGVELAALLALGAGELGEEVLVDAAEHVLGAGLFVTDPDVAEEVNELAEALLVECGAGIVLGEHALEGGVVALDDGDRLLGLPCGVTLSVGESKHRIRKPAPERLVVAELLK